MLWFATKEAWHKPRTAAPNLKNIIVCGHGCLHTFGLQCVCIYIGSKLLTSRQCQAKWFKGTLCSLFLKTSKKRCIDSYKSIPPQSSVVWLCLSQFLISFWFCMFWMFLGTVHSWGQDFIIPSWDLHFCLVSIFNFSEVFGINRTQ